MDNNEVSLDRKLTDFIINTNDNKVLIIDGSISTQCTKALNNVLKIKTDEVTGLALEYYANNPISSPSKYRDAKDFISKSKENGKQCGLFYTIDTDNTSLLDTVAFDDSVSMMDDNEKRNSALYIQGTMKPHSIANAVYKSALSNSVAVYYDIGSCIKHFERI